MDGKELNEINDHRAFFGQKLDFFSEGVLAWKFSARSKVLHCTKVVCISFWIKPKMTLFLVLVFCYWVFQKKCFCFFQMKISVPFIWGIIYFYTTDGFPRILEKTWSELICTRLYFFYCSTKHPDFVRHRVVIVKNFQLHGHKYKLWLGSISYILDIFCLNPNWIVAFGWCFFEKWSFSLLNFI